MILNIFLKVVGFNSPYSKARKHNLAKHLVLNLFLQLKQAGEHEQEQHIMSQNLLPPGIDELEAKVQRGRDGAVQSSLSRYSENARGYTWASRRVQTILRQGEQHSSRSLI